MQHTHIEALMIEVALTGGADAGARQMQTVSLKPENLEVLVQEDPESGHHTTQPLPS